MTLRRRGCLSLLLVLFVLTACNAGRNPPATSSPTPAAALGQATPASPAPVSASLTSPALASATPVLSAPAPGSSAVITGGLQLAPVSPLASPAAPVSPTSTLTPTAIATATLTPTPTAVQPPKARLEQGRWLQEIGDCDAARREFASAIENAPGSGLAPAEVSEARYRLAQCYLRDDAYVEAAASLNALLASAAADDAYRGPATFLLGEAQTALAQWDDAVASYTRYLQLAPDLASFTWQRIAAARKAAGNLPGAVEAYTNALNVSPNITNTVAIRRSLASLLLSQGNAAGAVAQYDLLRSGQTKGALAAEMQWLAGAALQQGGDKAGAVQRWHLATQADPTASFAHQAMAALVDAGAPVDEFLRGMIDYYNDIFGLAIDAFERLRATDPSGHNGEAWYYTGLSYLSLGQPDKAIPELGNFIAAHPESALWNDAWLYKARAQARAGDKSGALATYRQFAAEHPAAKQASTALWQAANLVAQDGNSPEAAAAYLEAGRRYPASSEGWQAYQAAGLAYYRLGDNRQAGQVWAEMAGNTQVPLFARTVGYYWLGRAQEAGGEAAAARASYQKAASNEPGSYYGMRAADRAAGAGQAIFGPGLRSLPANLDTGVDANALAAWLSTWAGQGSLVLPAAIRSDADWRSGEHLLTIGQRAAAIAAWSRLQRRYAGDPWAQASLALAFRAAGEYPLSITAAQRVAELAPAARKVPPALERLEYPLVLTPLIRETAAKWNVDPLLVAAVIRQESRFETGATSSAAAQGLMQVIPDTADWIATQLGWSTFSDEQIYWPYVNVEFGTYYLHRQLDAFGSVAVALAAYNGGPGNARTWVDRSPGDEDLMVALIHLPESRLYVQLVYQHYEAYRRLYAG